MGPFLRQKLSHLVGWLADRRVPTFLRRQVFGSYCRFTGANPAEAQLELAGYSSLSAFFVRRLKPGLRKVDESPELIVSPCDGTVQDVSRIENGAILQAKGRPYTVDELLAGAGSGIELEGGTAWTIYLGPKDYHRVHTPETGKLVEVRWIPGDRRSVAPKVLTRVERVFATNERAVLRIETERGPCFLVMVGALNVGRIRVVGVEHGDSPAKPRELTRGDELARFEMGSTVVLLFPPGTAEALPELVPDFPLQLGQPIGRYA